MAATSTGTLAGTIQKYFEKSWMERPEEEFRTPLANLDVADDATIPANRGQYAEFRKFDHMTPEVAAADDDSPKTYAEPAEPTDPLALNATIFQVCFELIRGFVDLGSVQTATDPIDLMRKNKDEMYLYIRRMMHQIANGHLVQGISRVLNSSGIPPASTYLPGGFRTLFVGGGGYEQLTADSVFSLDVFGEAKMLLANANIPKFPMAGTGGVYKCFIDEAICKQLLMDRDFREVVLQHRDLTKKVMEAGELVVWDGVQYIIQDDPYRTLLAAEGGTFTKRRNGGKVHVAHMFGPHAVGYTNFGGSSTEGALRRTAMKPTFKVQDISKTGTNTTVGFTVPFQFCVMDEDRGINIAGTSRYDRSIKDLVG